MTSPSPFDSANSLLAAGLSPFAVKADGSKAPALPKGHPILLAKRRATEGELREMFRPGRALGLAVKCGAVSGGLAVVDFDDPEAFAPWREIVEREAPELLARLVRVDTPRRSKGGAPGVHVAARVEGAPIKTEPLAYDGGRKVARIEVRGEGGYVIIPPSGGKVHVSGRPYGYAEGSPTYVDVPRITRDEWGILADAARSLDLAPREVAAPAAAKARYGGARPGDDFDARGDIRPLLIESGARLDHTRDGVEYWRRPGKDRGVSASLGFHKTKSGAPALHVFSTSWPPFEARRTYSAFVVYALLKHDGDFTAAAKALAAEGFGSPKAAPSRGPTAGSGGHPAILLTAQARDIRRDCWAALAGANDPPSLFRFGDGLAEVGSDLASGRAVVRMLDPMRLLRRLTEAADFYTLGRGGEARPAKPDAPTLGALLVDNPAGLPALVALSRVPILLSSPWRIVSAPGYDAGSRLWIDAPEIVRPATDKEELLRFFAEVLDGFHFADSSSALHVVAAMLQQIVRHATGGPFPLYVIDAADVNRGKSKLGGLIAAAVVGEEVPGRSLPEGDDETRKAITAALMAGASVVFFDNVRGPIEAASLARVLTLDMWGDRWLGQSRDVKAPNAALWLAAGNRVTVSDEIKERALLIRLGDPAKGSRLDPVRWTIENRPRILGALVYMIERWIAAGAPLVAEVRHPKARAFVPLVAGVLSANGFGTPEDLAARLDGNRDAIAAVDVHEIEEVVPAWWDEKRGEAVSSGWLLDLARPRGLLRSFLAVTSTRGAETRLGLRLAEIARNATRLAGGYRIEAGVRAGRAIYRLVPPAAKGSNGTGEGN